MVLQRGIEAKRKERRERNR